MMKVLKTQHFLILFAFISLCSCKKEKKLILKTDEPVLPHPIDTDEVDKGKYVPVKFESDGLSLLLKYKDNTGLLTEITDEDNNKIIITYTAGLLPQKLEKYNKGKLFHIVYYEQVDKKTTNKALTFTHKDKPSTLIPTGYYTLTYNAQQKIDLINHYNRDNALINTNTLSYTTTSNLSEINNAEPTNTKTYTFDKKIGISSNIAFAELFALEAEYWFLRCNSNNISTLLNKTPEERFNFNYQYNENDCPSNVTITDHKGKQTIKIAYKRLE